KGSRIARGRNIAEVEREQLSIVLQNLRLIAPVIDDKYHKPGYPEHPGDAQRMTSPGDALRQAGIARCRSRKGGAMVDRGIGHGVCSQMRFLQGLGEN